MGFFSKLKEGLLKTKSGIGSQVNRVFSTFRKVDEELLEELEEVLIMSDLGMETSLEIISNLRETIKLNNIKEPEEVKKELKNIIIEKLTVEDDLKSEKKCILVVGVNGAGKTTAIGKLAYKYKKEGKKVLLVPADTFRAAAGEQLELWAKRAGVDITEVKEKEDPSATVYRSLEYSKNKEYDIIIVDTAGRLHNNKNLMNELSKINKTVEKMLPSEYSKETYLVLDGTIGQNAIEQSKQFSEIADVDAYILTKLDGTSKGGVIIGIVERTQKPVKYIGIGEKIEDLETFNPVDFTETIFE